MLYERCAAIYIGKDVIAIAVRLPTTDGVAGLRSGCRQGVLRVLRDRAMAGLTGGSLTWLRRPPGFTACWSAVP
jgi:hypothetical protein